MKCRLCDRPTAAGTGKLCADCAKALRRARGAALSKLPHGAAVAAEPTRAPPITLTVGAPAAAAPRSNRAVFWVAVAGVVAITLVYVVQREFSTPGSPEAAPTSRPPAALTERVNVEPSPVVTKVEEPSWTTVGDAARDSAGAEGSQRAAAVSAAKGTVAPAGGKPGTKTGKAASQDAKAMPLPPPAEYDVAAPKPAEADPPQQLAGGKVATPAQPVDGAQVLASAMQKCGNEGGFSKFICEQKTYFAYCEDKWDKDPRCMRKVGER
jgi:hypothetical protein